MVPRLIPAMLAIATTLVAGGAIATAAPVNIYGIDDANSIWEIDPVAKQFTRVNDTGLGGQSNSMAYDTTRDQFFFTNAATSSLRFWGRGSTGAGSTPAVATLSQIGVGTDPANASYYDNSYWYVTGGQQLLHRVSFSYAGTTPAFSTTTPISLAASGYPASNYGDIAINAKTGVLYGTTTGGLFYRINLATAGQPGSYTAIRTGLTSLQVSFNADYSTLFAHSYNTGRWYTLDTSNGDLTDLDFATVVPGTSNGFRDLGGASTTDTGSTCDIAPPGNSDDQFAQVGTTVRYPPKVRIVGSDGAPQAGVEVTFTVTAGGGTIGGQSTVTVATDEDGIATAPAWRMGASAGRNTVRADNVGTVCNLTFSATATAGPPPDPDGPNDGGGTTPQKPVTPLVFPDALNDPGVTSLLKLPIRTNAGQVARARITCTINGTGRLAPGRRCRGFIDRRVLKVRVTCGRPLRVRVLVTAPATDQYREMRRSRTYITTGACAVTG